ncbi:MAG: hypothetical protein ACK5XN_21125 [Bacteroidota bacterium]|jgi:hypothetical protein
MTSVFLPTKHPVVGWAITGHLSQVQPVTILSGQSISSYLDFKSPELLGYTPFGVITPSAWDTAKLSIQVSVDATNWVDFYLWNSDFETHHNVSPSQIHVITDYPLIGMPYVRFRSGTASAPVNQTANRTLQIVCGTF